MVAKTGVAVERTQHVGVVYGVIGVLIASFGVGFSFTTLGHAERYLPGAEKGPLLGLPVAPSELRTEDQPLTD